MVGVTEPASHENGSLRVVYTDLDGTLLGPGGSLFADPDGRSTREPVEAVLALADAGVELVPITGRTRDQTRDVARLVGARTYGAELGALLVYRVPGGEEVVRAYPAMAGTPVERIHQTGAAGFVLDSYAGRLEPHTPWSRHPRECTILLRGLVDVDDVNAALGASGNGWLELVDNGRLARGAERFPHLEGGEVRAYHLAPAGTSKASGRRAGPGPPWPRPGGVRGDRGRTGRRGDGAPRSARCSWWPTGPTPGPPTQRTSGSRSGRTGWGSRTRSGPCSARSPRWAGSRRRG